MRPATILGPAACAAIAIAIALPTEAGADPIADLLCGSGSSQFCPPPPPPPSGECHPSYDPCLPITSDVDCAGGSGDGPVYSGPVRVIGPDDYGLDSDGDGFGCENS
ncbi:hypothetical protein BOX37_08495 [Nocardia mangyaensis]|uniref:Excalibur calcium-binding domain-containing protein n=1 Tax=Nocardia mangyaensis TaxID=2213200 RepID=A0A1J0VPN9_9NOCA|nr:hypothetical protein [Nocardia mangyaensis]APE34003.1 hypothetical protein BOX37_08495 [Nocardia mangyaensis]